MNKELRYKLGRLYEELLVAEVILDQTKGELMAVQERINTVRCRLMELASDETQ